jgi:hypothetical protein
MEVVKMAIYRFWYENGEFLMEIEAKTRIVKKLLNEYRKSNPEEYNDEEWLKFLRKKGIKAKFIKPKVSIYF